MALMLLSGMPASAQKSYGISGKVTDQTGNGIAGASVIVKGTTTGTSTGSDGSYSLNVKDGNATLVCSFIGMKSAEAAVNGRTEVNFTLEADAIGLEEVIAIGYGSIRKEEITTLVEAPTPEEFRRIFNGTYYGKKYEQLTVASLEEFYNYILRSILEQEARKDPYSVAVIYSYLYHKEHEVNRLTIALECVRYGVDPEQSLRYIRNG